MRKNSPRKWVHAILDLLPLVILPIFALAVRSDNNFQPISITVNEGSYQPKYETNVVSSADDLIINNIYALNLENQSIFDVTHGYLTFELLSDLEINDTLTLEDSDVDFPLLGSHTIIQFENPGDSSANIYTFFSTLQLEEYNYTCFYGYTGTFGNNVYIKLIDFDSVSYQNFSISDYNEYIYVENTPIIYNDADVGSQLVYTLYNATDKYFNFNNVFNFGQLYDWFVLNIFNGNVTLIFPVVWNIVLYEFIMDLIFLVYSLFMFFIDFCTNMIEGVHRSVR